MVLIVFCCMIIRFLLVKENQSNIDVLLTLI